MIKIIAKGLFLHKNSYFRDGWNLLDFLVVFTTILELLLMQNNTNLRSIKVLRVLRALRPLKSINAIPSMKKLINILFKSAPKLLSVIGLLGFVIILLGIFGL